MEGGASSPPRKAEEYPPRGADEAAPSIRMAVAEAAKLSRRRETPARNAGAFRYRLRRATRFRKHVLMEQKMGQMTPVAAMNEHAKLDPIVSDITVMLRAVQDSDPQGAEKLLPLVYEDLRRVASHRMAHQPAGHTLQATALVHEAFLRLI